jgi:hypothetical protein
LTYRQQPSDLLQLDTKELRLAFEVVVKHFSARDMVSLWDVVEVHERSTSLTPRDSCICR